jgi:hypothetical protein
MHDAGAGSSITDKVSARKPPTKTASLKDTPNPKINGGKNGGR